MSLSDVQLSFISFLKKLNNCNENIETILIVLKNELMYQKEHKIEIEFKKCANPEKKHNTITEVEAFNKESRIQQKLKEIIQIQEFQNRMKIEDDILTERLTRERLIEVQERFRLIQEKLNQ